MKLSDKKFLGTSGGRTASQKSTASKQDIKAALNPASSAEVLFDKIAQLAGGGLMAPAMGQVQPQPKKMLSPVHEGMWLPREIKKHYRKLRSMGYGINDADMAVEDVLRQGAGGAGQEDERVKDFMRRLWYATISTKPHEESLYKLASALYAGLGGDTLSTEEIEGTGKVAEEEKEAQATPGAAPGLPAGDTMPMPPAGGEPAAPAPAPEDLMADEPEMSLEEALQQLEEASQVVVEKVQNGEALDSSGQEMIPEPPMDAGSTPAPSPKVSEDKTAQVLPLKKLDKPEHVYDSDGNIVKTVLERSEAPKSTPKAPGPKPMSHGEISTQYGDDVANLLRMKEEARELFQKHQDKVDPATAHKVLRSMGDFSGLTSDEFMKAYEVMKAADDKVRSRKHPKPSMSSPSAPKSPGKSLNPGALKGLSKADERAKINEMIEKMKNHLTKQSVDQDAKDYWHDLFGEYGDQLTEDRVASAVDAAEEIFAAHGFKPSASQFNSIIDFVISDRNARSASLFGVVSSLAQRDAKFASVVDRMMLNYLAKNASSFKSAPYDIRNEVFVIAAHDADATDGILTYVAQKMKMPKVEGQPSNAVDIDQPKDEALKSKQTKQLAHIPFELDESEFRGKYLHMTIKWDVDHPAAKDKGDEALMHAVTSFVKGLESTKEFKDLGFLGQINFSEFDATAGLAEIYVRSNKGGDATPVVKTE